jgi:hypothetical protein
VKVSRDLAMEIHRQSKGRMREIMNAIALVERVAKLNDLEEISLKHVQNQQLTLDWQTAKHRFSAVAGGN